MKFFNSFTCNHFVFNMKGKYSEYLRVLILPFRGVLLCPFWMTIIWMMYSVAGFRPEQKHHISCPVNSLVLKKYIEIQRVAIWYYLTLKLDPISWTRNDLDVPVMVAQFWPAWGCGMSSCGAPPVSSQVMQYPVICVGGGCQVKEMDVGVKDINRRLVGAWTTGLTVKKRRNHICH